MKYLFKKNGEEYTKYSIEKIVDIINSEGLVAIVRLCKELDYPFKPEIWLHTIVDQEVTEEGLLKYFNQLDLIAYRPFHFEDTDEDYKQMIKPNKVKSKADEIKEKIDIVTLPRETLDKITQDRLDFGFDSIYFRYSEAIEELSYYKEREAHKECTHFDRKHWADGCKMHFYNCLEQLLRVHEDNNGLNS